FGVDHAWPVVKLCKTLMLVRIVRVGYREGVSAAAVEGLIEVHDFRSDFAIVCFSLCNFASGKKFADLPVHGYFEGILNGQCSVINKECMVKSFRYCYLSEHFYKLRHFLSVNVRVCDLVYRNAEYLFFEFRSFELGVVH